MLLKIHFLSTVYEQRNGSINLHLAEYFSVYMETRSFNFNI